MTELERLKKESDEAEADFCQALIDVAEATKYLSEKRMPFVYARLRYLDYRLKKVKKEEKA